MEKEAVIWADEWYTEKKGARLQIKSNEPVVPARVRFAESWAEWGTKFKTACEAAWPGIEPKEVRSAGSDYEEIYVKAKDNNAYLSCGGLQISVSRWWDNDDLIYEFTAAKAAGLLYDLGYRGEVSGE